MQSHFSEARLAVRWQISKRTLQRWRREGSGPAYLRLGGRVTYRIEDIIAFEAEARVAPKLSMAKDSGQD